MAIVCDRRFIDGIVITSPEDGGLILQITVGKIHVCFELILEHFCLGKSALKFGGCQIVFKAKLGIKLFGRHLSVSTPYL